MVVPITPIVPATGHLRAILINNNAPRTRSPIVDLILSAEDATEMMLSNVADFTGASWEMYVSAKEWIVLDEIVGPGFGDGEKTVYVKFRSSTPIESAAHSATIYLDTAPPVVGPTPIRINNNELTTNSRDVILRFDVTGASFIEILNEVDEVTLHGTRVPYASQVSWTLSPNNGRKTVLANFFDDIENSTGFFSAEIILVGQAPNDPIILSPADGSITADHFITITGVGDPDSAIRVKITKA